MDTPASLSQSGALTAPDLGNRLAAWNAAKTPWANRPEKLAAQQKEFALFGAAIADINNHSTTLTARIQAEETLWIDAFADKDPEQVARMLLEASDRTIPLAHISKEYRLHYGSRGWTITVQGQGGAKTQQIPVYPAIAFWVQHINTSYQWPSMLHWLYKKLDEIAAAAPSPPPPPPAEE